MRLWGGRFEGDTDSRTADFTRSIEIDSALAIDDIAVRSPTFAAGSAGLLEPAEVDALITGLEGCGRRSRQAPSPGIRRSRTST